MQPTVAPGGAPPWWLEEAFAAEGGRDDAPPLEGDVTVDVAIVGGGYTGLWTALAVLDRDPRRERRASSRPSSAAPGRADGTAASSRGIGRRSRQLRDLFGAEGAIRLATAGEAIRPAVRALGDDVWLRESGMLMVATTEAQDARDRPRGRHGRRRRPPGAGRRTLARGGRGTLPLTAVPARRALPRHGHRPAGQVGACPAAVGARARRVALRGTRGDRDRPTAWSRRRAAGCVPSGSSSPRTRR